MISFLRLGDYGQLGNQMFQFAAVYSLAKTKGYELKIPIENTVNRNHHGHKLDLFDCFNIPETFLIEGNQIQPNLSFLYNEVGHHYNKSFFDIEDGTNIQGYYQTEKYFENYKDDIYNLFSFKKDLYNKCNKVLYDIKSNYNLEVVSLHVRRGDYVANQACHPLCSLDYYIEAIQSQFSDKNYIFHIFSDDIEWCKQIFSGENNLVFSESNSHFEDICMLTLSDHNIIANSSFSWWGAWLNQNPNKRVIAPSNWFGPALSHLNIKDVIPENWIKI
jgi:hypothetical protein